MATIGENYISDITAISNDAADTILLDSSGIVKFPYVPSFMAYGISNNTYTDGSYLITEGTRYNNGNHYDNLSGRFTAPINGIYCFYWSSIGNTNDDIFHHYLRVNGANVTGTRLLRLDNRTSGSQYASNYAQTITIELNAGDYVQVYLDSSSGSSWYPSSNTSGAQSHYIYFTGYLIA